VYRFLAEKYHYTPNQIAEMTPYQHQVLYSEDRTEKVQTYEEAKALVERLNNG
jgi:hypothetical protein